MAIDVQASLVWQRMAILVQLAALAVKDRPVILVEKYRTEAQNLQKAFEDTEKAIAALQPARSLDLSSCESAIDAIVMLLTSELRPMTRRDIIARVIAGGLWGGKEGTGLRVKKSLTMHLKEDADSKMYGKIKEIQGLVGLFDWDPDLF